MKIASQSHLPPSHPDELDRIEPFTVSAQFAVQAQPEQEQEELAWEEQERPVNETCCFHSPPSQLPPCQLLEEISLTGAGSRHTGQLDKGGLARRDNVSLIYVRHTNTLLKVQVMGGFKSIYFWVNLGLTYLGK